MRSSACVPALLVAGLLAAAVVQAAGPLASGCLLRVAATSPVTVTLAAEPGWATGEHFYRQADGAWATLPGVVVKDGTVTFALTPALMPNGLTTVVLAKPAGVDLSDATPPRLVRALLDGREVDWPAAGLDLGWIDEAPKTIELRIADERSDLDPAALRVTLNGNSLAADAPGLRFVTDPATPRQAALTCDLATLLSKAPQGTIRLRFGIDDRAVDDQRLETGLSFTVSASPQIALTDATVTAPNGMRILVDSCYSGYENIDCLVDGALQVPDSSTRGSTWASAETPADHWACLILPAPRAVSAVAISWAHFGGLFRSSARFDILTWDGQAWQRAVRVQDNPAEQTTRHRFESRTTDRVMIWVPAGGNHPGRPDLTWITEISLGE